ncbi:hypothetical protein MKW94_008781 [Papaver nudicaule]|uniref:Uncharacterized protein n=1 Tax=Papaver nudicaule TaxID=74823 RepID=A0AA41VGG7_PAPNU|nr:hypothetical protein [Papaver nudicaule]
MSTGRDFKVDDKTTNPISIENVEIEEEEEKVKKWGKTSVEIEEEARITTEDVIRAGGFGARDDIGSFLPVAMDSTDFEASIRDARGYEDSVINPDPAIIQEEQGESKRPGLGWNPTAVRN